MLETYTFTIKGSRNDNFSVPVSKDKLENMYIKTLFEGMDACAKNGAFRRDKTYPPYVYGLLTDLLEVVKKSEDEGAIVLIYGQPTKATIHMNGTTYKEPRTSTFHTVAEVLKQASVPFDSNIHKVTKDGQAVDESMYLYKVFGLESNCELTIAYK